jgi:hypothetical protein
MTESGMVSPYNSLVELFQGRRMITLKYAGQPDTSPAPVSTGSLPLIRTDNREDIGTTPPQSRTSLVQHEMEAHIYRLDAQLFVGIMQELDLERYEPLWQGIGILGLQSLSAFIDRPYTMFIMIVEYMRLTTPEFPYVTHICYNDAGEVVATAIITVLKLFAKRIVDIYTRDMVNAAATIPTHQILSLFLGFRNLYFRTAYNHVLRYLTDT